MLANCLSYNEENEHNPTEIEEVLSNIKSFILVLKLYSNTFDNFSFVRCYFLSVIFLPRYTTLKINNVMSAIIIHNLNESH